MTPLLLNEGREGPSVATHSINQTFPATEAATPRLSSVSAIFQTKSSSPGEQGANIDDGLRAMRGLAFILLLQCVVGAIATVLFWWSFWHVRH
jgi:hypothetical protein